MNKKQLQNFWNWFRNVRPWYFLVAFMVFGAISLFALRTNNLRMVELRDAVYAADRDNGDIEAALQNLRSFVTGHMNTSLSSGDNAVYPPIQLKYTYERLVAAAGDQTAKANQDIYNAAQSYCEQAIPTGFSGRGRVECIENYVAQNTPIAQKTNIPDSLYKFDFVSPTWSPDLAGFSVLAAIINLAAFLLTLLLNRLTRRSPQ